MLGRDAGSLAIPVLTVTGPANGGGDPDVLAYARTLAGERSMVVAINNQRTPVELRALAGGGIPVAGLLVDGAVTDLTGNGVRLEVAGSRLRGVVPALTAVVLQLRASAGTTRWRVPPPAATCPAPRTGASRRARSRECPRR